MSDNYLQFLAKSNKSNENGLRDVIQKWLDMNGQDGGAPVTWTTILDVIKGPLVQNNALARKIYEYLKLESSVQSGKCICNYFNHHCNVRGTSNINFIISQYYMKHNRDKLAMLILTVLIILTLIISDDHLYMSVCCIPEEDPC